MAGKTKAVLLAENERLRSKVREVYAAYYDMHARWDQLLTRMEDRNAALHVEQQAKWRNERLLAQIDGLKEQIIALREKKKKKKPAKV
jgi:hypothetical protein